MTSVRPAITSSLPRFIASQRTCLLGRSAAGFLRCRPASHNISPGCRPGEHHTVSTSGRHWAAALKPSAIACGRGPAPHCRVRPRRACCLCLLSENDRPTSPSPAHAPPRTRPPPAVPAPRAARPIRLIRSIGPIAGRSPALTLDSTAPKLPAPRHARPAPVLSPPTLHCLPLTPHSPSAIVQSFLSTPPWPIA